MSGFLPVECSRCAATPGSTVCVVCPVVQRSCNTNTILDPFCGQATLDQVRDQYAARRVKHVESRVVEKKELNP